MQAVSIKALCHYIPEGRMTNAEIIEQVRKENEDTLNQEDLDFLVYSFTRKLDFLEIDTRACWTDCEKDSSVNMAVRVCKDAIEKSGIHPDDIDLIISAGCINPFREPSFATIVAGQLNIDEADCFDINDTCNGFLKGIELSSLYINSGKYENVLMYTAENPFEMLKGMKDNCTITDINDADYKVNILFAGTGAAAMVLTRDHGERVVRDYYEKRSSKDWDISMVSYPQFWLPQNRFSGKRPGSWGDGRLTAAAVIKDMPQFIKDATDKLGIDLKSVNYIFMHQLGRNITFAILDKLGVDRTKVFPSNTFKTYGNMGSANIPIGFELAEEKGLLKKGDSVLLLSSACGISYSLAHIIW